MVDKKDKILTTIQSIILQKNNLNKIVYEENLVYPRYRSNFSSKINIDYWNILPDPPLNDSKKTTSDLTEVLRLANNRIVSETELAIKTDKDPMHLFSSYIKLYNISFPYDEFKELYTFLKQIILDLKYFYNRARPRQIARFYNLDIDVIQTDTHATPSYPSGHTAYAALIASILTDIRPKDKQIFWDAVDKCGLARILQGVHFRGDNDASIELVKKIYKPLKIVNNNLKS